jgi:hypothetical protein
MESWMVSILIVGFIIMISFWGLMALGKRELNKKKNQQTANYDDDYKFMHRDEFDGGATYDSNGRRLN